MLRKSVVACAAMTSLLSTASQYTAAYYLPIYFQAVKGVSPTRSGIYTFPSVGSTIIGTIIAGILSKSFLAKVSPNEQAKFLIISSNEEWLLRTILHFRLCNCSSRIRSPRHLGTWISCQALGRLCCDRWYRPRTSNDTNHYRCAKRSY